MPYYWLGSFDALEILIEIVAVIMAIFVAMPFHEFAHAFAAKHEGDYTAVAMKRCTLAPLAHFDTMGFIFLLLFRFGWAKPVPIDDRNFKRGKKSLFLVSIAGILANLILGVLFLFIYMLILRFCPGYFYNLGFYGKLVEEFLLISVSFNFMMVFFNILPLYPLDGYRILSCALKEDNAFLRFMKKYSFIIYLVFAFTGFYMFYYTYTAGLLTNGLIDLFQIILGF